MPWDEMFDDLEVRFAAHHDDARRAADADDERVRIAALTLADRLRACDEAVSVETAAGIARGRIGAVGADWLSVRGDDDETIVRFGAVLAVSLPPDAVARTLLPPPADDMLARMSFGFVARSLARSRTPVRVVRADGIVITGTIDRAGDDHLDIAEHDGDVQRRTSNLRRIVLLRFASLATITPAPGFRVPFS